MWNLINNEATLRRLILVRMCVAQWLNLMRLSRSQPPTATPPPASELPAAPTTWSCMRGGAPLVAEDNLLFFFVGLGLELAWDIGAALAPLSNLSAFAHERRATGFRASDGRRRRRRARARAKTAVPSSYWRRGCFSQAFELACSPAVLTFASARQADGVACRR